jgi:hypothetical protein
MRKSRLTLTLLVIPLALDGPSPLAAAAAEVSFRNDVMAVLSKAGCNAGVCHGNRYGKGGFALSLRGEDPAADFATLTRHQFSRRIDLLRPDESLVLRKPTMQTAHEGGRRFVRGSREYEILRQWIAAGMRDDAPSTPHLVGLEVTPHDAVLIAPRDSLQLRATATFSDGQHREVTGLAVYEPGSNAVSVTPAGQVSRHAFGETTVLVRYLRLQVPVRLAFVPARANFVWSHPPENNFVDRHVFAKLRRLRIKPAPLCDDSTFLRRAFLDLLGILPTADEARRFVSDSRPDKRARLIDALLDRPEFADHWALKWSDLLRVEEKTLDRKGVENFHRWIRQSIADGMPLDQFARELFAARGSTYKHPPANFYRANRDVLTRAEDAARAFLGVRLQCAKCHNHPFDRWTQDDYYGWAGFFARVQYKVLENRRRDRNDLHEFDGEQVVWLDRTSEVTHPRTGQPAPLRLLGSAVPPLPPDEDRLEALARWIGNPGNKLFVQAQVNRIWFHLLGRGIIDPVDDVRATNPAVNPELLDALAADFVKHGCELRHTIRAIMNSRVYQLSSKTNETSAADEANFSHADVRRLTAEQLIDAICQVLDVPLPFNGYPLGTRAGQLPGVQAVRLRDGPAALGDQFLKHFGKPPRLIACECERSGETTLTQAFQLVSGPAINDLLTRRDNRLGRLASSGKPPSEIIDELYWTALSRPPTAAESGRLTEYVQRATDRRQALEDIAWGLLNAKEFLFRR